MLHSKGVYSSKRMRPVLKLEMPQKKDTKYNLRSILESPTHAKNLSLYPNVTHISSLSEFFSYLTTTIDFSYEKSLIVFDIDDVLISSRKITSINSEDFMPINNINYEVGNCINELTKHADVICLTARNKICPPDFKSHNINLLQLCNKITLTAEQEQELNNFGYSYHEHANIIYTNMLEKGTALKTMYSFSKTEYDKVVFIDDNKNNCLSVLYRMHDNNIPIESCHLINTKLTTQQTCTLSMSGYPLKEKPYFHSDKNIINT